MTDQRGLTDNDVVVITSFGGTQATLSVAFAGYDDLSREISYTSKDELNQKIGADILEFKNDFSSKIFTIADDGEDVTLNDSFGAIVSDTFKGVKNSTFLKGVRKSVKNKLKEIQDKADEKDEEDSDKTEENSLGKG